MDIGKNSERPSDAGRTSGGGSLGHRQPPDTEEQAPIRNNPTPRSAEPDEDDVRPGGPALNVKI